MGTVTTGGSDFYGVDINEVNQYLANIKSQVIQEAIDKLQSGKDGLYNTFENGWNGTAQQNFKDNFDKAVEETKKALENAYNGLQSEVYTIAQSWVNQDSEMVRRA